MPTLDLSTNVPVDAVVASDILKDCTRTVAKILGKPESNTFKAHCLFCFVGDIDALDGKKSMPLPVLPSVRRNFPVLAF